MQFARRAEMITPSSTLAITAKANELKASGFDVIGLGAGQPDFNTPEFIIDAANEAAQAGHTKYTPSAGLPELKDAIIKKLKRDQGFDYERNQIIVGNGAKHVLYLLFQALLNPSDEVIIPAPYWVSYTEQVKLAGGVPVAIETSERSHFKITVADLEKAVTAKTKAVLINSPSNPTGMIYSKEELEPIAEFCVKNDLVIISDEIYEKLVYNGNHFFSIAQLSKSVKAQTVVVNGVSKSHSMTGWRIGYAAADAALIQAMTNIASHSTSNPASVSQYAAIAAYNGPQESIEDMRQAFEQRLNTIYPRLINLPGVTCVKPQGAFYLFPNVRPLSDACGFTCVTDWVKALLDEEKVAVVPGAGFGMPDYIRLSYATSLDNLEKALDRIEHFIKEHTK
ncbi:pyridoxal phosphate-dependent aminotransferase [Sporolactobacillus inulinus]|uniref:Aminotransferase n=1 Tax=Sporolactobacillus inulinus CASD TaxID=1069536 RepID=A0A0U1QSQ4_9BACL|nr:pyridoxal phosphate-dependent aminotransferase [Sporolactobacillus inulinus]KLI03827.1 aspartate aminotransferase [Sporolactobacillus inulinus CASD]GEB76090.1 aspartate aminotransferase [Sporolactobacillus inulinus]